MKNVAQLLKEFNVKTEFTPEEVSMFCSRYAMQAILNEFPEAMEGAVYHSREMCEDESEWYPKKDSKNKEHYFAARQIMLDMVKDNPSIVSAMHLTHYVETIMEAAVHRICQGIHVWDGDYKNNIIAIWDDAIERVKPDIDKIYLTMDIEETKTRIAQLQEKLNRLESN